MTTGNVRVNAPRWDHKVVRVIEYVGTRAWVEETIKRSLVNEKRSWAGAFGQIRELGIKREKGEA